jgi:hypothetical protein
MDALLNRKCSVMLRGRRSVSYQGKEPLYGRETAPRAHTTLPIRIAPKRIKIKSPRQQKSGLPQSGLCSWSVMTRPANVSGLLFVVYVLLEDFCSNRQSNTRQYQRLDVSLREI